MLSNILFHHFFLPLESVKLGRFIVSIEHPHLDYHDPAFADAPKAVTAIRNHYTGLLQGASNTGFASALNSLLSSGMSKRAETSIRIETDQVKTYTLENSGQRFIEAMNQEETRKWVENAIDQDRDIYLVVGFHTLLNARIIQRSLQGREAAGQFKLSISLSLAAIGAVVPLGNIIDPYIAAITRLESRYVLCSISECATTGFRAVTRAGIICC